MLHLLLAHGNPWAGCCTYIITSSLWHRGNKPPASQGNSED
jgi:hypothetical protein